MFYFLNDNGIRKIQTNNKMMKQLGSNGISGGSTIAMCKQVMTLETVVLVKYLIMIIEAAVVLDCLLFFWIKWGLWFKCWGIYVLMVKAATNEISTLH